MVSASAFSALAGAISSMAPSLSGVPQITSQAAAGAAQDLKRSKSSSGRMYATSRGNEERLRRRSRKMTKEFQESMEKNVKRKLDRMTGPSDNRKVGLKVAQFIPGKGLEVPGAQSETDPSIYCSLGIKSDKLVDPLDETFSRIKGRQVSMDFAFKLIKDKDNVVSHDKKTRVTAFNAFRHVNPDSFNYRLTGWHTDGSSLPNQEANYNWHSTLGPDAAPIRRATGGLLGNNTRAGVWRGIKNDQPVTHTGGLATVLNGSAYDPDTGAAIQANSLMSPFRYPKDLEIMYSRINRQLMENYGWKLNPFKFVNFSQMTQYDSTRETPSIGSLNLWQDPNDRLMDFNDNDDATESNLKWSFPANVNNSVHASTSSSPDGGRFEYHSQFGPGRLSYQFQNDGTNPVCIDMCVIGIKKDSPVPVELMKHIFEYNYKIDQRQSAGVTNVNGFQTEDLDSATDTTQPDTLDWTQGVTDWHADAKLPFIPDSCFKNPASYIKAVGFTPGTTSSGKAAREVFEALEQGKKNPFKVVKRDQFIVSSGSSRAWNTTLPSIKYRSQLYEDVEYPFEPQGGAYSEENKLVSTADEYTFVLAIGASGLPKPVEEVFPIVADTSDGQTTANFQDTDAKAIVDRQPSTCNVSVVGTYTETIQPVFPKDVSNVNFINGRLTAPYFASAPTSYHHSGHHVAPDRVNTVDIAQLGQVVHTTSDGIVGVGAITTDVGA